MAISCSSNPDSEKVKLAPCRPQRNRWGLALGLTFLATTFVVIDFLAFDSYALVPDQVLSWRHFLERSGGFFDAAIFLVFACGCIQQLARRAPSEQLQASSDRSRAAEPKVLAGQQVTGGSKGTSKKALASLHQALDQVAKTGDAAEASRLLQEHELRHGPPEAMSYNLVIRAYAKKGDFRTAGRWLARMEEQRVKATICSYNTVLDACAKAGNAKACESWLEKMLAQGLEANVISYATVISAFAHRGDEASAVSWQKRMLAAGVEPDAVSYNSLIHACSVKGRVEAAERWLEEMHARGLQANVTTYATLIDACAKAGDLARAEKWMTDILRSGIQPNIVTFGAMIDACAKASNLERAEHWHIKMLSLGIKPNVRTYSALINACAKAGKAEAAEEWLRQLQATPGLKCDAVVYSSVIDACGKAGDCDRAMAVFESMKARGIRPHVVTFSALARPFAYRGDWQQVDRIAEEMLANGDLPNDYFVYAHILAYATAKPRQAERAERLFREVVRLGVKANEHIVLSLSRAVGRKRAAELVQELCGDSPQLPARRGGAAKTTRGKVCD